jgi:hypothetical protein
MDKQRKFSGGFAQNPSAKVLPLIIMNNFDTPYKIPIMPLKK